MNDQAIEIVKMLGPYVSATFGPLITTLVKSAFEQKWSEHFKDASEKPQTEYLLSRYIAYGMSQYASINSVVLGNESKPLDDLYVPLTIKRIGSSNHTNSTVKLDRFPKALFNQHRHILVMDTAGMGKSTLMRFLYVSCIRNKAGLIPLLIELRRLPKDKNVIDCIASAIDSVGADLNDKHRFSRKRLAAMISTGGFLFLLDGYDEIPSPDKEKVTASLMDFVNKANGNAFVLSSRDDDGAKSFGFTAYNVQELSNDEAYALIRKYDKFNDNDIKGESLIYELKDGFKLKSAQSFLGNPLLVSLLFVAYLESRSVDINKCTFYRTVFDALYKRHDLLKPQSFEREKRTGLGQDDFFQAVSSLGFVTFKYGVDYDINRFYKLAHEAAQLVVGPKFTVADLADDLTRAVPLMVRDGSYIRWGHKSIQEFFFANFAASLTQKEAIFRGIRHNKELDRFLNIIELLCEIDFKTSSRSFIIDDVRHYLDYHEEIVRKYSSALGKEDASLLASISYCHSFDGESRSVSLHHTDKFPIQLSLSIPEYNPGVKLWLFTYRRNRGMEICTNIDDIYPKIRAHADLLNTRDAAAFHFVKGVDIENSLLSPEHIRSYLTLLCSTFTRFVPIIAFNQRLAIPDETKCKTFIAEIENSKKLESSDQLLGLI